MGDQSGLVCPKLATPGGNELMLLGRLTSAALRALYYALGLDSLGKKRRVQTGVGT